MRLERHLFRPPRWHQPQCRDQLGHTAIFAEASDLRSHDFTHANCAFAQDLRTQSSAMEQAFDDPRPLRELLQMIAGFTKPYPANLYFADKEFLTDQVIQGDVASYQIPTRIARSKLDTIVSAERLDRFGFDQGQLVIWLGLEERALLPRVAVAFQANSGNGVNFGDCTHGFFRAISDVDGFDGALPHFFSLNTAMEDARPRASPDKTQTGEDARPPSTLPRFVPDNFDAFTEHVKGDISLVFGNHERRREANGARSAAQEQNAALECQLDDAVAL